MKENTTEFPSPPRARAPERKTFESEQGRFSYLEWDFAGPSAQWLHFAHANGFNAQTYTRLLERLAHRYHIFAMDARGHGLTKAPTQPGSLGNTWKLYEEDLYDFVHYLGRPMILVGHSLGAVTSMQVAAHYPEWVRSLLLLDPVILPRNILRLWHVAKVLRLNHRFHLAARAANRRSLWPDKETMVRVYRGRGGFRSWNCSGCIEEYIEGGTRNKLSGEVELTCDPLWESETFRSLPHDTWQNLARVQAPTTILYGEKSDTFLSAAAKRVRKHHPVIQLLAVPEATHFVPMEEQEIVAHAIQETAGTGAERHPLSGHGESS